MLKETSSIMPQQVQYEIVNQELANVWINKNVTETYIQEEDLPRETVYEYDQVFFTVNPQILPEQDILNDVDFYFEHADLDGGSANHLSIPSLREAKHAEVSQACQAIIVNGVDVMINGEIQHFSLTELDQINLMGLQTMVLTNAQLIPYHCDGKPCVYYSLTDATTILNKALGHKIYHTTYCNSLFNLINNLDRASDIYNITYGDVIPEQYQSDVLKDLLK